ncbi:GntR family transcriptional regulator [Alphaproteobacteria bacterium]|nr:GntR family transcriptional regulator [Alphaproteobacteria bacterium]
MSAIPLRASSVEHIVVSLQDDISTGALAPGQRLDEARLAERFNVSRTPVREALSRLSAQGVLVSAGKRGLQVADYTSEELSKIFEAMLEIEIACARLASQRMTLLVQMQIRDAQHKCMAAAEAGDRHGYQRANEVFHKAIYDATGNMFIADIAWEFRQRTGPFRAKKLVSDGDLIAAAQSHEAMLISLFSEDSEQASEGMRAHTISSYLATLRANS